MPPGRSLRSSPETRGRAGRHRAAPPMCPPTAAAPSRIAAADGQLHRDRRPARRRPGSATTSTGSSRTRGAGRVQGITEHEGRPDPPRLALEHDQGPGCAVVQADAVVSRRDEPADPDALPTCAAMSRRSMSTADAERAGRRSRRPGIRAPSVGESRAGAGVGPLGVATAHRGGLAEIDVAGRRGTSANRRSVAVGYGRFDDADDGAAGPSTRRGRHPAAGEAADQDLGAPPSWQLGGPPIPLRWTSRTVP